MKQLAMAAALAAALTACGGGGGGDAAQPAPAPASYKLGKPSINDFESRKVTWDEVLSTGATRASSYWQTEVATEVRPDGTYLKAKVGTVTGSSGMRTYTEYAADGAIMMVIDNCSTVYTPAFAAIPGTLALGQSWDTSATRTCTNDSTVNVPVTSKGSVAGIETVTVPAGTFSALKTTFTSTRKQANGTIVRTATCWRDTVTGIELKCENKEVGTPVNPALPTYTQTIVSELGGYSHAATGRQNLNIERFAGSWQVWFKGTSDGTCTVTIGRTGTVTGDCANNYGIGFGIAGSVDAQGVARFNLTGGLGGGGFSGTFESPLKISGTWSAGSDSGTWYMLHM